MFQRLQNTLSENTPLRKVEISTEESKILASFGLLTRKPVLIVFNMGEGQDAPVWEFETPSVALQGKLEMEIAQLPPEEAEVFLQEYGIQEPSLHRVIRLSGGRIISGFVRGIGCEYFNNPVAPGDSVERFNDLQHDEIDLGFVHGRVTPTGLDGFCYHSEPFVACLPADHRPVFLRH